ncbi:hypothetical protein [Kineococcus sp. NPDC059986]|uniref:hypothetical protein n=1 Tax=Kineococcus sp. NPDC059986 TaxID=3155538 RepID=UPI00344E7EE7
MGERQTVIRSLHDIGLAAWFGGSLFGAVGLNGASAAVGDPSDRTHVAALGWARWAPVNAAALAAHSVGAIGLLSANRGRDVAAAMKKLKVLQWTIPALTGVLLVLTAQQGEQQKASQVVKGLLPSPLR